MAFGQSMVQATNASSTSADNAKDYVNIWMDPQRGVYRQGRRVFRILPIMKNGKMEVPTEVSFAEYWIPVMQGGKQRQQRVMVDFTNRFRNPIWERLYEHLPKEINGRPNENRKLAKQRFALNIFDKTKVIKLPDGTYAYPNADGKYVMSTGDNQTTPVQGTPEALMQVRILEGSTGKVGGKHMLRSLSDLVGSVTHPEDDSRTLHLYEFDIALKVSGEGTATVRSFMLGGSIAPLTDEQLALPRFNLEEWTRPWPHNIINALLDGEDFDEVMKGSGIVLTPRIIKPDISEDDDSE